ncbi:MAG: oligosaccharide flippase family protein, partial [Candidatus Beckwithbacteria bacterium]
VSLLVLGKILGLPAMGVLGWAEKWANLALRYFLDATVKVAFPLFSRLQHKLEKASQSLEAFVYFIATMVLPVLSGAYLLMPRIVETIPKYEKWQPGLTTFNLFLLSASVAAISTFLTNFLMAMGKIKQVVGLMVFWTILTLSLYPFMAVKYGYIGVGMASLMVSLTSVIAYLLVIRVVKFNLIVNVLPAVVSSIFMIGVVKQIDQYLPLGYKGLLSIILVGFISYSGCLLIINGNKLKQQIRLFIRYAKT